jgi:hypothetical protein
MWQLRHSSSAKTGLDPRDAAMAEDNEGAPESLLVVKPPGAPSTATFSVFGGEVAAAAASLRAGFLTEAARAGASLPKMQEVSRQKKLEVLLGCIRSAKLFEDHAGSGFL